MLVWARRLTGLIAILTILSGAVQLVAPAVVLKVVGATIAPATTHFFGIIGMFMVLFGGLLWQSVQSDPPLAAPLFWTALQKFGAAAAVGLGAWRGLFGAVALLVASFDLMSGVVILWYWSRSRRIGESIRPAP